MRHGGELGFEVVHTLSSKDVGAGGGVTGRMGCTQHVLCEHYIGVFGSAQRVVFVADARIVRGSFGGVEVTCERITLGTSVVVFVTGLNTREAGVSTWLSTDFGGLLVSKLVEVDLLAGDLAGFGVIIDLCDLFGFLSPFRIECWHDILGWDRVFSVISLLRGFGGDFDLLSGFLLTLRSAGRRGLGGLHLALRVEFALLIETQSVVKAGFEMIELLALVDVLEMTFQLRNVSIVVS